jgi:hypothetical protein
LKYVLAGGRVLWQFIIDCREHPKVGQLAMRLASKCLYVFFMLKYYCAAHMTCYIQVSRLCNFD